LFLSDKNAGGYGFNGWSAYNAVGEYLDHYREAPAKDRAMSSMDLNSWVSKKKLEAQSRILALA
jgi:hypothetical protein